MPHRGGAAASACLALFFVAVIALGVGLAPRTVLSASPSPPIVSGGDTRSEGEGAGFVGSPLFVALGVVAIGVGTALATVAVVRLTRRDA